MNMRTLHLPPSIRTSLMLLLFLFCWHLSESSLASSLSGAVSGLAIDQSGSLREIKAALTLLQSSFTEAREKNALTLDFQKLILSKAGECTSKIVELSQADSLPGTKKQEVKNLLVTTRDIIKEILTLNQKKVEDLQEHRLDQLNEENAFFTSAEWQEPQFLISLASYWLSWNGYYTALFYPESDTTRRKLLEEAVSGFARTSIDFKEESILVKSLFGRAFCYKEMQHYDKALQDFNLILAKVTRDDPLYLQSRFEKVMISYLTGNYETALHQSQELLDDVGIEKVPLPFRDQLKKLQAKIHFALLEKKALQPGKEVSGASLETLHELARAAETNENLAGELYQFVLDHAATFANLSSTELGSIGALAVADWHFNQKRFDRAASLYQHLATTADPLIKKQMGDIYFRLGYCHCQNNNWQEALVCFETLFEKFPHAASADKAACLYYAAAANTYRDNPSGGSYDRYIKAIKCYFSNCPDPQSGSEAHFQLAKYYQRKGMREESLKEFSSVGKDSPNYSEALYTLITTHIDELKSLDEKGLRHSERSKKLYKDTLKRLEECRKKVAEQAATSARSDLEARLTVLLAQLYTYGPEGKAEKALETLAGSENRFSLLKQEQLILTTKILRIECYQQMGLSKKAEEEITSLLKEGAVDSQRWYLATDCANRYYNKTKALRYKGHQEEARSQALLALTFYEKLSAIAARNNSFTQFYDALKIRMAELYSDTGQTAHAREIYLEKLTHDPQSSDALYQLSLLYEKESRWEDALATWKKLSQGQQPGSYRWFESRYHSAHILTTLGKIKEACDRITVIQVLYPDLGDEELKEKFLKLRDEFCTKQDKSVTSNER